MDKMKPKWNQYIITRGRESRMIRGQKTARSETKSYGDNGSKNSRMALPSSKSRIFLTIFLFLSLHVYTPSSLDEKFLINNIPFFLNFLLFVCFISLPSFHQLCLILTPLARLQFNFAFDPCRTALVSLFPFG